MVKKFRKIAVTLATLLEKFSYNFFHFFLLRFVLGDPFVRLPLRVALPVLSGEGDHGGCGPSASL